MKKQIFFWSDIEKRVMINLAGAGGSVHPMRTVTRNDGRLSIGLRKEPAKRRREKYFTDRLNGIGHNLYLFFTHWTAPKSVLVSSGILVLAGMWFVAFGSMSEPAIDNAAADAANTGFVQKVSRSGYLAKWQRFKRGSEQTLKTNEYRIVAFKVKMEEAGPKFKARYINQVGRLEQINLGLKKTLEEYPDEGQGKWEEFRASLTGDIESEGESMTALFKDDK